MQQGGSQYGVPPQESSSSFPGSGELPPPTAEAASPISSLPPPPPASNFDELSGFPVDDDLTAAGGDEAERGGGAAASAGGGNRWPRQETLALLKIRSEMDAAFRDATLKAPLWEEVSRKLAQLGYNRSAKKCKEKFENVHKYYKRTKEGRAGRQDGKHYRFFSQLEALSSPSATAAAGGPSANPPVPQATPPAAVPGLSDASTSSDESDSDGGGAAGKRKMMAFFKGLMRQVVDRQEAMQKRFLETIEKREQERMMREEAWRRQDMSRLAREHEAAAHDRAVSAARDAAIISFLQRLSGQPPPPPPEASATAAEGGVTAAAAEGGAAASRWPKAEVQALIKLRGEMEAKYDEMGPKGPLWEEISSGMRRLGYSRSAKRCKEKWENINKYFKKVKESNKRRPEDSKTCPYFHQLDALYRKKQVPAGASPPPQPHEAEDGGGAAASSSLKPGDSVMELTGRQEEERLAQQATEKVNSEEMLSDEGEGEEEQYRIQYQQTSRVNGTMNGGGAAVAAGAFMAVIQ